MSVEGFSLESVEQMLTWDLAKKLLRFLLVLVGIERLDELGLGRLILR